MQIQTAKTADDILKCWQVLFVLRPHLVQDDFVATVQQMITEGYILTFIEKEGKAVAAAGYRYMQSLFMGKHYHVDDLSTLPTERGNGYASLLLDYVTEEAQKNNLAAVTLDSGYSRNTAHRLYLNKGFDLSAHHFTRKL